MVVKFCEQFPDQVTGFHYMGYTIGREKMVDFLKLLQAAVPVDMCFVTEDVERDMKNVSGTYSLDTVISDFRRIVNGAASGADFYISVHLAQNRVIFLYPREEKENLYTQAKGEYVPLEELVNIQVEHDER